MHLPLLISLFALSLLQQSTGAMLPDNIGSCPLSSYDRMQVEYRRESYSPMLWFRDGSRYCAVAKLSCRLRVNYHIDDEVTRLRDPGGGSRRLPLYDTAMHELLSHIALEASPLAESVLISGNGIRIPNYPTTLRWHHSMENIPDTCVWENETLLAYASPFVEGLRPRVIRRHDLHKNDRTVLAAAVIWIGDTLTGKQDRYQYNMLWNERGELMPMDFEGWKHEGMRESGSWKSKLTSALQQHPFANMPGLDLCKGPGRKLLTAALKIVREACGPDDEECNSIRAYVNDMMESDTLYQTILAIETAALHSHLTPRVQCCRIEDPNRSQFGQLCDACATSQFKSIKLISNVVHSRLSDDKCTFGATTPAEFLGIVVQKRLAAIWELLDRMAKTCGIASIECSYVIKTQI